jgi:hypothetical protein
MESLGPNSTVVADPDASQYNTTLPSFVGKLAGGILINLTLQPRRCDASIAVEEKMDLFARKHRIPSTHVRTNPFEDLVQGDWE